MDRRVLLIIASCGLAAASLLLWLQAALALNDVWVVLCLLAVQQAFYAVNSPTRSAAIPRMLPGPQLAAANSLNMTVTQFGAIVGPLLAGLMLNWVNLSTLYLIDALTRLPPIWATFRLAPMPATGAADDLGGSARWGVAAVLAGFRYLGGNTVVLMSFVVDLIAMILGMPRALFPQLAHESFGGPLQGGTTVALLAAAMSVGAVAGGVFSGPLPRVRRQGLLVVIAVMVWGGAMLGFGLVRGAAQAGRARCSGRGWAFWRSAVQRTWFRLPSARRSCSRRPPTSCAAGCRACSSWWWREDRGWQTPCTAPRRRWSGRRPRSPGEELQWSPPSRSPRLPCRRSRVTARLGYVSVADAAPAQARLRNTDYLQL